MVKLNNISSFDLVSSPSFNEAVLIDLKKLEREKKKKLQELRKKKIKNICV